MGNIEALAAFKGQSRNKVEQLILLPTDTGHVREFPLELASLSSTLHYHGEHVRRIGLDPTGMRRV
jgi:hypothetical protein